MIEPVPPDDESRLWPGGDPIVRLACHLKNIDAWSDEEHEKCNRRIEQEVAAVYKEPNRTAPSPMGLWIHLKRWSMMSTKHCPIIWNSNATS